MNADANMKVWRTSVAALLVALGLFNLLGTAFGLLQPQVAAYDILATHPRVLQEQNGSCPLDLTRVQSIPCTEGAQKDAGKRSECCVEALTGFSQSLADYCNRTVGAPLFLTAEDEKACAGDWPEGLHNRTQQGNHTGTCSIYPPAYTANVSQDVGGSVCYYAKRQDLEDALVKAANFSLAEVAADCQLVDDQFCNSNCRYMFHRASTSLSGETGDNGTACQTALLVAIASLDIQNQNKTKALYECVTTSYSTQVHYPPRGLERLWQILFIMSAMFVILTAAFLIRRSLRQRKPRNKQNGNVFGKGEAEEGSSKNDTATVQTTATSRSDPHSALYSFSAKELWRATDSFSDNNFLGEGSAGTVYRGSLPSGQLVAVKRIDKEKKLDTFFKEVENLSRVRHPNLATLLGLCQTGDEHLLVYEYCSKGNLSQLLFGDGPPLTWEQRISIAVGAAKGIWFLHLYPGGYIVHRDIKPTNILLNEHMEAKVSDFGLSRFISINESDVVTEVRGTTGYMDPEYINAGTLTFASDVYSLGVVILQLISGRRPYNFGFDGQQSYSLIKEAAKAYTTGNLDDLVDPRLNGIYSEPAYQKMLDIAVACTEQYSHNRPSMNEVLDDLDEAWRLALTNSPSRHTPDVST